MVAQLCDYKLQEEVNLVLFHQAFMTCLCLMNIVSSLVTIVGNLLVIPALWKSSSLTLSMKVQRYPTKPLHKISAPQAHVFLAGKFFIV